MTPAPILQIERLAFAHPGGKRPLLDIDHLSLAARERLFVRGPSGSGKSTLMSLMAGVLIARSGGVSLLGTDWAQVGALARDLHRADHVGYLFQQFNLLGWLSVMDNVTLPCRFSRRRRQRALDQASTVEDAAARWLQAFDIAPPSWHLPAAQLSVGQQQRVAAARALIGQPELVLADEPTSALDAGLRDRFMQHLLEACDAAQSALVFVSHDDALARHFSRTLTLDIAQ